MVMLHEENEPAKEQVICHGVPKQIVASVGASSKPLEQ
jgi:hypothetical protein